MDKHYKPTLLGLHIVTTLFLLYLAWAIITRTHIPEYIGFFIIFILLLYGILYAYMHFKNKDDDDDPKNYGLQFDPNDPKYKRIGGLSGTGWL